MQLRTAVEEFLLAGTADGLKEKTLAWYSYTLGHLVDWIGARELEAVTVRDMRLYFVHLREQEFSEDTIHGHNRATFRFWRWVETEYKVTNPMINIKRMKQPRPKTPKAVNVDDVIKLLEACDHSLLGRRDKAIVAFLMDTGCRAAGLCGLRLGDLDLEQGRAIVIEKGSKRRAVLFTDITAHLIRAWLDVRIVTEVDTVFVGKQGEPLTPNGLLQMLTRLKKRAGVTGRVNPHAFRHGFAREYLRNGGDLATLSRIMGHEGQEVTALYYAVFTSEELQSAHRQYSPMKKISRVMDTTDSDQL